MTIEYFKMHDEDGIKRNVEAEIGRIHQRLERTLKNFFGQYNVSMDMLSAGGNLPSGVIEDKVLEASVRSVTYENKQGSMTRVKMRPGQVWDSLPDLRDDVSGEGIGERLVRLAVKHNSWLGRHRTYSMVFSPYMPEDAEKLDPTQDSSTNGSSTASLPPVVEEEQTLAS